MLVIGLALCGAHLYCRVTYWAMVLLHVGCAPSTGVLRSWNRSGSPAIPYHLQQRSPPGDYLQDSYSRHVACGAVGALCAREQESSLRENGVEVSSGDRVETFFTPSEDELLSSGDLEDSRGAEKRVS